MKLGRLFAGSLLALGVSASVAFAQSTGPAPGGGSTAPTPGGGASGGSATPTVPTDLDLPLEKPEYQGPPIPPAPTPPPPPPDDPRDTPPPTIYGEEIVSENDTLIYVIDRSGSMDWDEASYVDLDGRRRTGTRMERAKAEISRSIMGLSQNFRFNIVGFDCGTVQWRSNMVPADDANKQSALAWVRRLEPQGATGTGPAVALGLRNRDNKLVVLLTDGAPNCGVPEYDNSWSYSENNTMNGHRRMISNANTQGAKINVFGIAASGTYRRFCQNVASDSGGSYTDVP
jgi:hypothetical protein